MGKYKFYIKIGSFDEDDKLFNNNVEIELPVNENDGNNIDTIESNFLELAKPAIKKAIEKQCEEVSKKKQLKNKNN